SILLIVLGFSIYYIYKPVKFIALYGDKFQVIEKSLTIIEENMEEVTTDNNWNNLKSLTKAEESAEAGYNMLIQDIKDCYLQFKDMDKKTSNLKILDYKEKRTISNKDYKYFLDNNSCIESLDKYKSFTFSSDSSLNSKLQSQIGLIMSTEKLDHNLEKFNEILVKESNIIHSVANLTSWLKIEYNTYK
ncbi:MAG: hypothetical protein PHF21_01985, partial [Bacilli bacterium]|nr:hypothetical protein [Bacilli bacterium]